MSGINEQFSHNPQFNIFGLVTGTQSVVYFPSGSAKLLRFKAAPGNAGVFYLGSLPPNVATWPLSAGDDTGWIAPNSVDGNLGGLTNFCYSNPAMSGTATQADYLHYWIQR